jgi:hypothetical protein
MMYRLFLPLLNHLPQSLFLTKKNNLKMRITQHVLHTWIVAQVFHPPLFALWLQLEGSTIQPEEQLSLLLLVFLLSAPAFLICLLIFKPILQLFADDRTRFFIWMVAAVCSVLSAIFLITALIGGAHLFLALVDLVVPGCVAATLSIMLRAKHFFRLLNQYDNHYENA